MNTKTKTTAACIGYALRPDGYEVITYDSNMQPLDEYTAGNHPLDSQSFLALDDPHRVPDAKLLEWAQQTAGETAEKWGVPAAKIFRDHDNEKDARDALGLDKP